MQQRIVLSLCIGFLLGAFCCFDSSRAETLESIDESGTVILAYGRIGDGYGPENMLAAEAFGEHIKILTSGEYQVIPLNRINDPSPYAKNAVITFEGAYQSALKNAIPLLLQNNLPFTVLYASDQADDISGMYMNWDDLKTLHNNPLVTLGILPSDSQILTMKSELDLLTMLNKTKTKHRDIFHEEPQIFSYPFGVYDTQMNDHVRRQGYQIGLALNSGPASAMSDPLALPRFSVTEAYADPDHFQMILSTLPLPVSNLTPTAPSHIERQPSIGFNLNEALNPEKLRCYASDQPPPRIEILGENRIELRLKKPILERTRVNCILPVLEDGEETPKNWRWLGLLLSP